MKSFQSFIKKIFYKHDYTYTYLCMIDGGMRKLYCGECKKYGKVRYRAF